MPLAPGVVEYRKRGSGRFRYRKPPHKQQVEGNLLPFYLLAPSLPLPLPLTILVLCDQRSGDRVLSDSLPSVFMRQFFGTNLCAPCLLITFLDSSQGDPGSDRDAHLALSRHAVCFSQAMRSALVQAARLDALALPWIRNCERVLHFMGREVEGR